MIVTKLKRRKKKRRRSRAWIQILDIPLNYKPYEIRAVFSKYGKIEDLYTRVKGFCYLEQHTVRVIPLLLNDESRENRYGFALKLTGLPFGTTGREVNELLKGSGAKSIVIPRNPKNYNLLKYAMVYFPDKDVLTEAASLELKIKGSKSSSYADITRGGSNNRRRQQSHSNNNHRKWNEKNIIYDNPYMGNKGHRQLKSTDPVRQDIEKAATSLNNNNKRVHIEDSGSSSDSGMDEFEAKLSKSDEKIEQNMTLLTQIAKKLDSLSSKFTSSSNTAGLEDEDNVIVED
ncbi:unnamed protein product [Rhizophagus irregularis]|nr:unnamed protein product [Rhizophagus irregularis]